MVAPAPVETTPNFAGLDGIRAFAAVAVVVFHVTGHVGRDVGTGSVVDLSADAWTSPLGNYGVCVFFLLSGFLLFRPFVAAHLASRPGPDVRSYFRRRLLRIFPAYWIVMVFVFFLREERRPRTGAGYLGHAALVQTFSPSGFFEGLGVAWTLCVEVSFYAVLPLIAWAILRLPGATSDNRSDRLAAQLAGLSILFAIGWIWHLLPLVHERGGAPSHMWLPNFLDWFALGMLLAVAHSWRAVGGRLPSAVTHLADLPWLCWIFALQLYWVGVQLRIDGSFGGPPIQPGERYARAAINGLSAFLVLLPVVLGTRPGRLLRALEHRWVVGMGLVSYGLYLWHQPVISELVDGGVEPTFLPLFVGTMVITTVVATASLLGVERPAMRLAMRRAPTRRRRKKALVPT